MSTYTGSELVGDVTFEPLKLGLFFGTCHNAGIRRVCVEPRKTSITTFLRKIDRLHNDISIGQNSTTIVSWSTSCIGKFTLPSM